MEQGKKRVNQLFKHVSSVFVLPVICTQTQKGFALKNFKQNKSFWYAGQRAFSCPKAGNTVQKPIVNNQASVSRIRVITKKIQRCVQVFRIPVPKFPPRYANKLCILAALSKLVVCAHLGIWELPVDRLFLLRTSE